MAVKSEDEQTRSMIAYAQIILDLARRYGGSGWLAYNTHFWAQLFAGKPFKWNEVNPSLLASAFFGNPRLGEGAKTCSRCMAAEHSTAECAVAASEDPKPTVQATPPPATRQSSARQATLPYPHHAQRNRVAGITRVSVARGHVDMTITAKTATGAPTQLPNAKGKPRKPESPTQKLQ